VSKQQQR